MRRDIFQENYKGNAVKVLFADLVVFLLVTIFSIGFCYSYFSDEVKATGNTTTAVVTVAYRADYDDAGSSETIYGCINNASGTAQEISTKNIALTPGDALYIKGYAVNTSNVAVYVLAKLEIEITEQVDENTTTTTTETHWYNIANNQLVDSTATGSYTSQAGVYKVGASSLEAYDSKYERDDFYKELSIKYEYDGATHTNAHTITSIKLTLHVHQKEYLRQADDFTKYSTEEVEGKIGDYTTESIYAAHQITGKTL